MKTKSLTGSDTALFHDALEREALELRGILRNRRGANIESVAEECERTVLATERELTVDLVDRASTRLREVESALHRIAEGSYGACTDCDEPISVCRLAAIPSASRCVRCQEKGDSATGFAAKSHAASAAASGATRSNSKSFLFIALVLFCCPTLNLWAQTSAVDAARSAAENRLARSAATLRTFEENASEPTRKLLDNAHCIGVAPRRDRDQDGVDARGFVSCRENRKGAWTNPAAIAISGGGTFWPVLGTEIDVIILAMNQPAGSRFGDRDGMLGSPKLHTTPGPVRQDQVPLRNYPSILVYQQSNEGVSGINLAGAAISEDRDANAVLYGKELSNLTILGRDAGAAGPLSLESFLAALPSSTEGQSGRMTLPAASPKEVIAQPE